MRPGLVVSGLYAVVATCLALPQQAPPPPVQDPDGEYMPDLEIYPSVSKPDVVTPALIGAGIALVGAGALNAWTHYTFRQLRAAGQDSSRPTLGGPRRMPDRTEWLKRRAQMAAKIDQVDLLRYLRAHREQTFQTYRKQRPPKGARWRLNFPRVGAPLFWFPEDVREYQDCARLADIPRSASTTAWPYKTPEDWLKMEKCVFYALGILAQEDVLGGRPIEEYVESWRQGKELKKGGRAKKKKNKDISEFSLENPLKGIGLPQGVLAEAALGKAWDGVKKNAAVAGTVASQMASQARLPKAGGVLKMPAVHP